MGDEKKLIVYVEDSPSARAMVTEELESHGYQIMTATDAADLERRILSQDDLRARVAMFILDLEMPQMIGTQIGAVMDQLYPEFKEIPFIIYSARPEQEVIQAVDEVISYSGSFSKNYRGYILKQAGSMEGLVNKVIEVMGKP